MKGLMTEIKKNHLEFTKHCLLMYRIILCHRFSSDDCSYNLYFAIIHFIR